MPDRRLGHLADDADRPDLVQIVGARLVRVVLLEQGQDHAVAGERPIHRLDRHRAVHPERRDAQRQHDRAAQGNDRKLGGKRGAGGSAMRQEPVYTGGGKFEV